MSREFKKLIAILMIVTMFTAVLGGCGKEKDNDKNVTQNKETNENETGENATGENETDKNGDEDEGEFVLTLPNGLEESEIFVEAVEGIEDDFIRGMDASAVLANENSGAVYYGFSGEEQDVYKTLAQGGVNYIRLRVWNDPYDENGNGYGGGNNDLPTAIELGKRATKYGMKVCIDFHYSDFWADPKRQHAPKAWADMSADEKCDALYDYTIDSLTQLLEAGVDVGMVQIGNEINYGMSGETDTEAVCNLLISGSKAVREISKQYEKDIQVVVHYTRINEPENLYALVANLQEYSVDYDILGLSFYPFWDGTMENMQTVVKTVIDTYGKKVMIAETSYCYTAEDGDGYDNSLVGIDDGVEGYPATVQGQATMIRDVIAAAHEAGAMGVFYWEGTWTPVGKAYTDNSALWEKYGSGWASSYAGNYDPDDAGLYYGGCSWDNQAMFDFNGHPLASLNVYKYLKYGSTTEVSIDFIPEVYVTCSVGGTVVLPETVDVIYNDHSVKASTVTWDESILSDIDMTTGGIYEITGTLEGGEEVKGQLEIVMINYVKNPGFEESDTSMWTITGTDGSNPTDFQEKADDAYSGNYSLHYYSESEMDFSAEQKFTDLEAGTYQFMLYAQGGDIAEGSVMEIYAKTSEGEQVASFMVTTWVDWKNPIISGIKVTDGELTIGVRVKCNAKGWGTFDEFTLNRVSD